MNSIRFVQWHKNGTPAGVAGASALFVAAGPVSRILSVPASRDGTIIPLGRALLRGSSDLPEGCDGSSRSVSGTEVPASLPIWSCSVWGLPCPRHHCRGGALLPHLFTLTPPILARTLRPFAFPARMGGAVYFLWHFPSSGLEAALPDVIRHTALRSSDFPPRRFRKFFPVDQNLPNRRGDRPVRLPTASLYASAPRTPDLSARTLATGFRRSLSAGCELTVTLIPFRPRSGVRGRVPHGRGPDSGGRVHAHS